MSLFVHRENQQILWNAIHPHPLFVEFASRYPQQTEAWFQTAVGQFYAKLTVSIATTAQLLEINKQAIAWMIQDLRAKVGKPVPLSASEPVAAGGGFHLSESLARGYEPYDVNKEKQRKEEEKQSLFSNYQSNYNAMFQRNAPKTVDFSEPMHDGKIENIDSLIRQQQVLREQDMVPFAQPAATPTPDEMKHKLRGIAANETSDVARFTTSEPSVPEIIIQPPSSSEWGSYTTDDHSHYETYRRG